MRLDVRLGHHVQPSCNVKDDYRTRWIKKLTSEGLIPKIELVETVDSKEAMYEAEKFWITQFRALGFRLVNTAEGGRGGSGKRSKPMSQEQRDKIAATLTGRKQPRDVVERRNAANRGVPKSPRTEEHTINTVRSRGILPIRDSEGRVFELLRDAALYHKISPCTVYRSLRGVKSKGVRFEYVKVEN
jgi:hypothetical protein